MDGYTKYVTYTMETSAQPYEVDAWGPDHVLVTETRKNGQEDSHMSGEVHLTDGAWKMDDFGRESIGGWDGMEVVKEIEAHLDRHGPPVQEDT